MKFLKKRTKKLVKTKNLVLYLQRRQRGEIKEQRAKMKEEEREISCTTKIYFTDDTRTINQRAYSCRVGGDADPMG